MRLAYVPQPRQALFHQTTANQILYGGAAGGGKLASVDTPIPTLFGWTTMGEIAIGDQVFDENGMVCKVVGKSEVSFEKTYELEFSDKSKIVCGERHQWITKSLLERTRALKCTDDHREKRRATRVKRGTGKRPDLVLRNSQLAKPINPPLMSIRTTSEIAETLLVRGRVNHSIPVAGYLRTEEVDLLVEPYVLGVWLGDGSSDSGQITGLDEQIFSEVASCGYKVSQHKAVKSRGILGVIGKLRQLGVEGNKHIPPAYLRASFEQRLALLQGLMDTDGYCDKMGQCEISLTRKQLIDDVYELIVSLGIKASINEGRATIDGRYISKKWRIKFITEHPVFRLSRKLIRQKRSGFRGTHEERYIVAAKEIPQVPLQCIEVDSPSHCYLIGKSMIPTHNSHCLRWDAIDFCLKIPNLNATLFRRTLPMLLKNHIIPLRRELPSSLGLGSYNETRKTYEFRNGSLLQFQHIEYDRDCDDIQGAELHWAGVDEAGQLTPYMISWILSRVRLGEASDRFKQYAKLDPSIQPYIDRLPRLAMSSNPGGESHHWLKENFIDPAPAETMFEVSHKSPLTGRVIKKTRIFIPASMTDNTYLDADYEAQFDGMPEWQQKQLIEGNWNVVPGAFFDCWDSRNVVKPFKIPEHWTRLWACDWGFRQPFAIGEFVVSDGSEIQDYTGESVQYPEDALILVREWYGQEKGNKGIRMSAYDVGRVLVDWRDAEIKVADPSMWRTDSGPSPAERFAQAGIYWSRADNERDAGWQEMYARIKDKMLLAVDVCRNFIRIIPTLEHDEKKLEDVAKKGEDHLGDMGRYACMARPYKKDKPKIERPWYETIRVPTFDEVMNRNRPSQGPEII